MNTFFFLHWTFNKVKEILQSELSIEELQGDLSYELALLSLLISNQTHF